MEPKAFTREQWRVLRQTTDEEGMSAATEVMTSSAHWTYLHKIDEWDTPGSQPSADMPEAVVALLQDTALPEWIASIPDLDGAMERACDLFQEYATEFILALMCKSLPECYAAGRGSDVLVYTGQLGEPVRGHPGADEAMVRRVMETAVFVRNVMIHENWTNSLVAIRTIQKIRMFHCGIRVMIDKRNAAHSKPWDFAELGQPINQMDMAGTLLTFSQQSCRGARALGVDISEQQERDFILHWIVIGHHLGINEDILRAIYTRPADVWDDIAELEFGLTPLKSGITLVTALQNFIERHVFTDVQFLHVSSLLMEDLMEPRAQKVVLTGAFARDEAHAFERLVAFLLKTVHKVLLSLPFTRRSTIRRLGMGLIETTIERWANGRKPVITIENELEEYARG